MPMVNVREMGVTVLELHMLVGVRVWLSAIPVEIMGVAVVPFVSVRMLMG